MKKFWGYVSNNEFSVGCTGQTVFIYDKDGNELGEFKDIIYGYTPMISPDGKFFINIERQKRCFALCNFGL